MNFQESDDYENFLKEYFQDNEESISSSSYDSSDYSNLFYYPSTEYDDLGWSRKRRQIEFLVGSLFGGGLTSFISHFTGKSTSDRLQVLEEQSKQAQKDINQNFQTLSNNFASLRQSVSSNEKLLEKQICQLRGDFDLNLYLEHEQSLVNFLQEDLGDILDQKLPTSFYPSIRKLCNSCLLSDTEVGLEDIGEAKSGQMYSIYIQVRLKLFKYENIEPSLFGSSLNAGFLESTIFSRQHFSHHQITYSDQFLISIETNKTTPLEKCRSILQTDYCQRSKSVKNLQCIEGLLNGTADFCTVGSTLTSQPCQYDFFADQLLACHYISGNMTVTQKDSSGHNLLKDITNGCRVFNLNQHETNIICRSKKKESIIFDSNFLTYFTSTRFGSKPELLTGLVSNESLKELPKTSNLTTLTEFSHLLSMDPAIKESLNTYL